MTIVGAGSPWFLWSPPDWLLPRAVLVLEAAQTCNIRTHFQSPLLINTPSVALLCLNYKPQTQEYSTYSVMTRNPLSPNLDTLSLGTWHPGIFSAFDNLFHDQFQDFSGISLQLTVSTADAPLVFRREDGMIDGTSIRILDAMSSWLNFTPIYKPAISKCVLLNPTEPLFVRTIKHHIKFRIQM